MGCINCDAEILFKNEKDSDNDNYYYDNSNCYGLHVSTN